MNIFRTLLLTAILGVVTAFPAVAALPSSTIRQSTVMVICDNRKGSGAVIHQEQGFILTNGHIAIHPRTGILSTSCEVRLTGADTYTVTAVYTATPIRAILDMNTGLDFAVLRLHEQVVGSPTPIPQAIPISTQVLRGDPITVLGFPHTSDTIAFGSGQVLDFARGSFFFDAAITEGYSGGPVIDSQERLVGVATRLRLIMDESGEFVPVDYGAGDILPFLHWLDANHVGGYAEFIPSMAGDPYSTEPFVIRHENPDCDQVVRLSGNPAVYCLRADRVRSVFPDAQTYGSWFPDFSSVIMVTSEELSEYRLVGLVTHRAGTLIKTQSDPRVYLVMDSIGTIREIPSESYARSFFGDTWAMRVVDVSDAFFSAYHIVQPL